MLNFKITDSQRLILPKGPIVAADTTNLVAKFELTSLFAGEVRSYWNVRGVITDP